MERIESSLGRKFYSPRKIGKRDYSRNCSLSRWITSRNVRIIPSLRKYTLQSAPLNAVTGPIQRPRIKDKYGNITRRPRPPRDFSLSDLSPRLSLLFQHYLPPRVAPPPPMHLICSTIFSLPSYFTLLPPPPLFDNFSFPVTHLPDWWWLQRMQHRYSRNSYFSTLDFAFEWKISTLAPPLQDKKRLFDNS